MNNQEAFEAAVAGNWIAESFTRPDVSDGIGKFYLTGTSKGYSTFGDALSDGQVVFFAAFDDDCNREAGYGVFNGDDQSITPVETTASLANGVYIDGDVAPIAFPNGGTITGTFNAVAFNAIWEHIWNKDNPHEVVADQVEQDNENELGDSVQDALDNLSGIIKEWGEAIKHTAQNYVSELPPANPQKGDMWTDVGVTGEQYVWEGEYWVSVTGGGLGIDLSDPDNLPPSVVFDDVGDDVSLYDIALSRKINSISGKGQWVASPIGGGGDIDANDFVRTNSPGTQHMNGSFNQICWGTQGDDRGAYSAICIGQGTAAGPGMEGAAFYIETDNGSYEINNTAMYIREGKIQGRDGTILNGFTSVSAVDFLDADGNSIVGAPDARISDEQITSWDNPTVVDAYTKAESDAAFQPKGDYQPAGDYAASSHNHDNRYYKKAETKKVEVMTESEYNALGSKDANTVYMLT